MDLKWTDYNGASELLDGNEAWDDLAAVLANMPLHLKSSDQKGKVGSPIFSPVGTNLYVKHHLSKRDGWESNISIPTELRFMGKDVDHAKQGVVVEVQFSNYPFLLNNTIRSELFFKRETSFAGHGIKALIVVTKAGKFPSSNSTLYYEQAITQLTGLDGHEIFTLPVRVVGLFQEVGVEVPCVVLTYAEKRYSRTVDTEVPKRCKLTEGGSPNSQWGITILD